MSPSKQSRGERGSRASGYPTFFSSYRSIRSGGGRFAVESYLDFHGNRFTRRFDANSYITLVEAMNSHDVGRGRGGVPQALARIEALTLVLGISSDRLFPPLP